MDRTTVRDSYVLLIVSPFSATPFEASPFFFICFMSAIAAIEDTEFLWITEMNKATYTVRENSQKPSD